MARLIQGLIVLLLFASALSFRISQHRVHKKDGQLTGPKTAQHPSSDLESESTESKHTAGRVHTDDPEKSKPEDVNDGNKLQEVEVEVKSSQDDSRVQKQGNLEALEAKKGNDQQDVGESDQEENAENTQHGTKTNDEEDIKITQRDAEDSKDDKEDTGEKTIENSQVDHKSKVPKDTDGESKPSPLSLSDKPEIEVRSNASLVAFYATLSSNAGISSGSPILFDLVLVNEGGLYFGSSGQFGCPDVGTYVFLWSLTSQGNARGLGALAFGGDNLKAGPKTSFYSSSLNVNGNSQMISVVQCRTSPITAVIVRSTYSTPPTYIAGLTSFAGFRLSTGATDAVAFTAELSANVYLYPGGRIMFNKVVSNIGGHYDGRNGFFRCPDNGIYSFTVSTYYPMANNMWSVSRLMRDGASVIQGPTTYRATTAYDSGSSSVTALVQCQQGQDLYVEAEKSYTFSSTQYGADLTSFSGFRLCSQCADLVAFSAVLTENVTRSDVDVAFDDLLLSQGDAYNPVTGVFTCPDNDLYMFQWSATSIAGACYLNLYRSGIRNKQNFMTTQSSSHSYGTSGTSSQFSVMRCSPGDKVSLRGSSVTTSRYLLAGHTSFSGYRLPGQ